MRKLLIFLVCSTTYLFGELGIAELKNTFNCVQGTPNEVLSPVSGALLWNSHWLKSVWLYGPEESACTKLVRKIFYYNEQTGDFTVTKSKTSPTHLLAVYGLVGELINWYIQGREQLNKICENRKLVSESKMSKKEAIAGETIFKTQVNRRFVDLVKSRCEANLALWQGILQRLEDDDAQHKQRPAQKIGPEEAQKSVGSILKKLNPDLLNPIFEANCESNTDKAFFPSFMTDQILAAYWFITQSDNSRINDYINRILLQGQMCKEQLPDTYSSEEFEQPLTQENLEKLALQLLHKKIIANFPPFVNSAHYNYDTEISIPDCVESTMHNLMNVLLYNSKEGIYDFSLLPQNIPGSKILQNFYRKYPVEETLTHSTNQEWFNLIAELRSIDPSIQYNRKKCEAFGDEVNIVKIINALLGTNFSEFKDFESLSTKTRKIYIKRKAGTSDTYEMSIGPLELEILLRHGHGKITFILEADKLLGPLYEQLYHSQRNLARAIALLSAKALVSTSHPQNNYYVYALDLDNVNQAKTVFDQISADLGKKLTIHDPNIELIKKLIEIIVKKDKTLWPEIINTISQNFSIETAKKIFPNKDQILLNYPKTRELSPTTLQFLLDIGVDINAQDQNGITALVRTYFTLDDYSSYHREIAEKNFYTLLAKGADINIPSKSGETLLSYTKDGEDKLRKELIKRGANILVRNENNETLLTRTNDLEFAKYLLDHHVDVNTQTKNGTTALIRASLRNNINLVKLLLEHGAKADLENEEGNTALICAAENGNIEITKLLLDHNADINLQNKHGYTALMMAATIGNFNLVKLLFEHGANINLQNKAGSTALMHASSFDDNIETVLFLLDNGAQINHQSEHGTALQRAVTTGAVNMIKTLLAHEANPNTRGWYAGRRDNFVRTGVTPLMIAALNNKKDLATILLNNHAEINAVDDSGDSALILAAQGGHKDMVTFLLEHGADPTLKNNDGKTAADLAATPEIKQILKDAVAARK